MYGEDLPASTLRKATKTLTGKTWEEVRAEGVDEATRAKLEKEAMVEVPPVKEEEAMVEVPPARVEEEDNSDLLITTQPGWVLDRMDP